MGNHVAIKGDWQVTNGLEWLSDQLLKNSLENLVGVDQCLVTEIKGDVSANRLDTKN